MAPRKSAAAVAAKSAVPTSDVLSDIALDFLGPLTPPASPPALPIPFDDIEIADDASAATNGNDAGDDDFDMPMNGVDETASAPAPAPAPEIAPVPEPAPKPAPKPASKSVSKPASKPASKSASKPASKPALVASAPAAKTTPKKTAPKAAAKPKTAPKKTAKAAPEPNGVASSAQSAPPALPAQSAQPSKRRPPAEISDADRAAASLAAVAAMNAASVVADAMPDIAASEAAAPKRKRAQRIDQSYQYVQAAALQRTMKHGIEISRVESGSLEEHKIRITPEGFKMSLAVGDLRVSNLHDVSHLLMEIAGRKRMTQSDVNIANILLKFGPLPSAWPAEQRALFKLWTTKVPRGKRPSKDGVVAEAVVDVADVDDNDDDVNGDVAEEAGDDDNDDDINDDDDDDDAPIKRQRV